MRYLNKSDQSKILESGWKYSTVSQRRAIRGALLQEQQGYCAYTERYLSPIDAVDIEHFDGRLKETEKDSYWNWYAVHHWINQKKKKKIEPFLPILCPYNPDLSKRIVYANGLFQAIHEGDIEAVNLIEFLGWNDPTLAQYRMKFVNRKKEERQLFFSGDDAQFLSHLKSDPENLSFITVLEVELNLKLS